jgi:two-component system CheB/CheR fusion protein
MENALAEHDAIALDSVLDKVYRDGGYDFRDYKRGTVMRRLARRLYATGARTYPEYIQFLDTHPEEYQNFAEYLTIKMSGFFRSPYSFQQVTKLVLPEILSYRRKRGERNLRLWSTACARGEEPYSIAILVTEFLGHRQQDFDSLIYATDISQRALDEAQAGIYSVKDIEGLPDNILKSYFSHRGEGYEVRADIRQMVKFSYFDLSSTIQPPFTGIDCIFCCNVLIYLQKQLQERVLNMLYDSLATPGYLILGEVETPTNNLCEKVECLDSKARIYKKNGTSDHV